MEHRQEVNSSRIPVITIKAVGEVVDDRYEFGGRMSIDGTSIGSVTGVFPAAWLEGSRRRRGRPKNEPRKVAIALHESMALSGIHKTGESKRDARIKAARALSFKGDDDDVEKYIRTHAKHDTARAAMSDYDRILTFDGDATGDGRLALALRRDASLRVVDDALHVSGMAWGCQWGDGKAHCGSVDFFVHTDAPHVLAALPSWLRGGINSL